MGCTLHLHGLNSSVSCVVDPTGTQSAIEWLWSCADQHWQGAQSSAWLGCDRQDWLHSARESPAQLTSQILACIYWILLLDLFKPRQLTNSCQGTGCSGCSDLCMCIPPRTHAVSSAALAGMSPSADVSAFDYVMQCFHLLCMQCRLMQWPTSTKRNILSEKGSGSSLLSVGRHLGLKVLCNEGLGCACDMQRI